MAHAVRDTSRGQHEDTLLIAFLFWLLNLLVNKLVDIHVVLLSLSFPFRLGEPYGPLSASMQSRHRFRRTEQAVIFLVQLTCQFTITRNTKYQDTILSGGFPTESPRELQKGTKKRTAKIISNQSSSDVQPRRDMFKKGKRA